MAEYTLRRTSMDRSNDYGVRWCGADVGRCYLRNLIGSESQWYWTIYIGTHVARVVQGVPVTGFADTLEDAEAAFHKSFDAMLVAGVVDAPQISRSEAGGF